jgi:hypothetical protein
MGSRRFAMWANIYVAEKVRELDRERLAHIKHAELQKLASWRRPRVGSLAVVAGRSLRRLGEALELGRHSRVSARPYAWR